VAAAVPETAEIQKASRRGLVPAVAFRKGPVARSVAALWEKIAVGGGNGRVGRKFPLPFFR
jgi:hypothetical protein